MTRLIEQQVNSNLNLSQDAAVGAVYSGPAVLLVTVCSVALYLTVLGFSYRKLPGRMPLVCSNSLAISTWCHASTLPRPDVEDSRSRLAAPGRILGEVNRYGISTEFAENKLKLLTQKKMKWGVVRMPLAFYCQFDGVNKPVEHLSFGGEEDDVQSPIEGHLYA